MKLREVIVGSRSHNRSDNFDVLMNRYIMLRRKLKRLIDAVRSHHESLLQITDTRLEVANTIGSLTRSSPLEICTVRSPSKDQTEKCFKSYRSIHKEFAEKSEQCADNYEEFTIEYAIAWDMAVERRVTKSLEEAKILQRELDHYEKKVEYLLHSTNVTILKGKQVEGKTTEKLGRNEKKLSKATKEYDTFTEGMSILLEEVTLRSWKDLFPLLAKLAKFDVNTSVDAAEKMDNLKGVLDQLKVGATIYKGLKPDARMQELTNKQPSVISTSAICRNAKVQAGIEEIEDEYCNIIDDQMVLQNEEARKALFEIGPQEVGQSHIEPSKIVRTEREPPEMVPKSCLTIPFLKRQVSLNDEHLFSAHSYLTGYPPEDEVGHSPTTVPIYVADRYSVNTSYDRFSVH